MPDNKGNQHSTATPHFDGIKEGVVNDSLSSGSQTIRIFYPTRANKEGEDKRNPFHYTPQIDEEMKKFEERMRGSKIEF